MPIYRGPFNYSDLRIEVMLWKFVFGFIMHNQMRIIRFDLLLQVAKNP